jgi:UDP-N-acetylmuramate dehydrogenase
MIQVQEHIPIALFTVYKIGGSARYFTEVRTADEVREAIRFGRDKGVPFFILGAGSNILVSDQGYEGILIHMATSGISQNNVLLRLDAGVKMAQAVAASVKSGLAGFEWGIGIPGSVGGSVRGNAGCFGNEMGDVVHAVEVLDTDDTALPIKIFSNSECEFGYRHSIFKLHPAWVVLSVTLELRLDEPKKIQERVLTITKERNEKQDIGTKSCGCIFKNISWEETGKSKEDLLRSFSEFETIEDRKNIPASFLIDRAGLKGVREGGVVISPKHANFFVNEGNASAEDVRRLVERIKERVKETYGLELHEEIQYLGF